MGVKPFGLDVKPDSGQVHRKILVVYNDEEKIDCCKENPIMAFVRVRADPQPNCTGVAETPDICMVVADMPSVCTGVAENPPNHNIMAGNPAAVQIKRNGLMTTSGIETLEVVGLILARHFLYHFGKRDP